MKTPLDRTLEKIKKDKDNLKLYRRLARDLGDELPRRRLEVLSEFRTKLNRINDKNLYLEALSDLCAAYEDSIEPAILEEKYIKEQQHPLDFKILELASEKPASHNNYIDYFKHRRYEVIFDRINELILLNILEKPTPSLYQLTLKGERIFRRLKQKF